jgi:aryl-alcohol dehydrogenase-like predicted oxidoreductase
MYGPADEQESIATIHAALDRGVTLLDTGDFYGAGHNELLIGRALRDRRDRPLLSVKFGALRGPDGSWLGVDTRPAAIKNFLSYTLTRLGVAHVDIYRPARLDPSVPIEDIIEKLWEEDEQFMRLVNAVYDSEAVEGSLAEDDSEAACQCIRSRSAD